ncbi:hypothetical protein LT330_006534 [Penicillium expansum]|nr:hypothetical protein LT330_006534 [Penicillium expansum]
MKHKDPLSIAISTLTLLETSISIIGRLTAANKRRKALPSLLQEHLKELNDTQTIILVIRSEECLLTAAVTSGLAKIENLLLELLAYLQRLDPEGKSSTRQIAHQLIAGSKDEEELDGIFKRIHTAIKKISTHLAVAGVGLTRDTRDNIVANTAQIKQLDRTFREFFGNERGLKVAKLIKDQPVRKDGTIVLDPEDLNYIGVSFPRYGTTRIISNNLTRGQALQINGPIGRDEWTAISHLEIRNNEAESDSTQVNYPISGTQFASLLESRSQALHVKALKIMAPFILCILLFVLMYTGLGLYSAKN